MSEKPILFNNEMMRALLYGRKTQTRRCVKGAEDLTTYNEYTGEWKTHCYDEGVMSTGTIHCPYGELGDELWVRETFCISNMISSSYCPNESQQDDYNPCEVLVGYRSDESLRVYKDLMGREEDQAVSFLDKKGWIPSIHMPRWASRIQLRITDVRVERVQDISENDARDEGIETEYTGDGTIGAYLSCHDKFVILWDSINGANENKRWDANPLVWVIEFEVIK